jgi:Uma2 family endonuclease
VSNDCGIITRRAPHSVRGADIAFYSDTRLPANIPLPFRGYANVVPDLVFEVRSLTDRWTDVHTKVAEYLAADVDPVVILDEQTQRGWMYRADDEPVEFAQNELFKLPNPLEGWQVTVQQFFE